MIRRYSASSCASVLPPDFPSVPTSGPTSALGPISIPSRVGSSSTRQLLAGEGVVEQMLQGVPLPGGCFMRGRACGSENAQPQARTAPASRMECKSGQWPSQLAVGFPCSLLSEASAEAQGHSSTELDGSLVHPLIRVCTVARRAVRTGPTACVSIRFLSSHGSCGRAIDLRSRGLSHALLPLTTAVVLHGLGSISTASSAQLAARGERCEYPPSVEPILLYTSKLQPFDQPSMFFIIASIFLQTMTDCAHCSVVCATPTVWRRAVETNCFPMYVLA
jgi:hypothetical protein